MARYWITGARGFIGRHLCFWLAGQGHTVIGLGHGAWPAADAAANGLSGWLNGDIGASNLHSLCSVHGLPDVVFHLAGGSSVSAALANPREDFFRTVATTAELLEWMRQESPQTRLVAVSSAAVYGAGHEGPIHESAALRPCSPYGHHKLMMESLCRSYAGSYHLAVVVARLFSVYGADLRKQLLWDLCNRLDAGPAEIELHGSGNEVRDWTDVRDVVRALSHVSELAAEDMPTLNIGTGLGTSVSEIGDRVLAAFDSSRCDRAAVFNGRSRIGDPVSLQADAQKLNALGFDWRIPVSQGIQDYVRWFKSRNRNAG